MNELNQRVLELLCQDCRMPVSRIAVMLGVSEEDVACASRAWRMIASSCSTARW